MAVAEFISLRWYMEFDALGKNKVEEIFAEIRKWRRVTISFQCGFRYNIHFENFIKITCIIYAAESVISSIEELLYREALWQ